MNPLPPTLGTRFTIERELVAEEDLRRWSAVDTSTGEPVEAVGARAHALLRPGAREGFDQVCFAHPAVLPVVARFQTEQGPIIVRPRTQGTLVDVRLDPPEALALAEWLLPALADGAGAFGGELRPEDIAVDLQGRPMLAAIRIPRPESLARVPRHRAPELLAGGEPTEASDLFGLGVLLYRAVTGMDPWPADSAAQLRRRDQEAPRLREVRDVPEELDELVARLLALDPEVRRSALDLHAADATSPDPPRIALAPSHDAPAARAVAPARPVGGGTAPFAVVAPLAGVSRLDLHRLAIRTGVEPACLERAAERGQVWLLDSAETEAEAARVSRRFLNHGLPAEVQPTAAPSVVQWLVVAIVAGVLAVPVPPPFSYGFLVLAAVSLAFGLRNVSRVVPVARARAAQAERARAAAAGGPEGRVWALERRVRESDHLPPPLRADLKEAVEAAYAQLERIHAVEVALPPGADAERRAAQEQREALGRQLTLLELELSQAGADLLVDGESSRVETLGRLARTMRGEAR